VVLRLQSLEVLLRWFVVLSLGHFFFFFFVIMPSLFLRYKKPHAALAIARTKPINEKQITKESYFFFSFFSFFFVYIIYSLLRYKKSDRALAMAKTKPKIQNLLTKETSGSKNSSTRVRTGPRPT